MRVRDVALSVGVSESTYREWENGRKIQGEPYLKLARALSLSIQQLFGLKEEESQKKLNEEVKNIERSIEKIKAIVSQII